MRRLASVDYSVFLQISLIFLIIGCSEERTEPQDLGGQPLPKTSDFEPTHRIMVISSDGQWLLFESTEGTWRERTFVLYNLEKRRRYPVDNRNHADRLASVALDGRMAFFDKALSTFVLPTLSRNIFFIVSTVTADEKPMVEIEEETVARDSSTYPPVLEGFVEAQEVSRSEVLLMASVDAEERRPIARHRVSGVIGNNIEISDLRISPDRRYVSYRVLGTKAGSFSLDPKGYVVRLDGSKPPLFIGSPIHSPIIWHPSSERVLAYAVDSAGQRAIFSWPLVNY